MHRWRGFGQLHLLAEWTLMDSNLLYLGNGRFCVAKFFFFIEDSMEFNENLVDTAVVLVLTGFEIVNGQANKAKLRMIKHKTRTYVFQGCDIEVVL
jgi:hypothetical protein